MVESFSLVDHAYFSDSSFRLLGLHSVSQPTLFSLIPPIHPHLLLSFLVLIFLTQWSEGGPPVFTCHDIRELYMFLGTSSKIVLFVVFEEHLFRVAGVYRWRFRFNDFNFYINLLPKNKLGVIVTFYNFSTFLNLF